MKPWKLGAKFSLLLGIVWLFGSGLSIFTLSQHLNHQAEVAVRERAEILLTTMQAVRNYTRDHVGPILDLSSPLMDRFIEESIPNYAAQTIFTNFQDQDPEYQDFFYKEAAPNPTDPSDLADDFERQVLSKLEATLTTRPDILSGYRTLNGKKIFYLARPITVTDASCLACHGNPKDAPKKLLARYGDQNGFNWQLNALVAAQMIYVPADRIFQRGRENLWAVAQSLLSIFAFLFVVINLLLWGAVIKPLKVLTRVATQISDDSAVEPCPNDPHLSALTQRQDEPGQMARAFQYMIQVLGQREQDLQQAVQARTRSLEQEMRDRETAQDTLQTYARAINHDLRNLVMGISSLVQGLLFKTVDTLPKVSPEDAATRIQASGEEPIPVDPTALSLIQKSCDRQLNLMNSLMGVQASNIWKISLNQAPVDLRPLTQELASVYASKLRAADASLENRVAATLPLVYADSLQLQRVYENLIDNALKYNAQGLKIVLEASVCNHNPAMIHCIVSDNGVGIDPILSEKLFGIYERGDRQVQGYGLGLYICKKIIEAHGGKIGVETQLNQGAQFWFTLKRLNEHAC